MAICCRAGGLHSKLDAGEFLSWRAHVVDGWMSKVQGRGRGSGAAERVATSAEQTFRGGIFLLNSRPIYNVSYLVFTFFSSDHAPVASHFLTCSISLAGLGLRATPSIPSPSLLPRRVTHSRSASTCRRTDLPPPPPLLMPIISSGTARLVVTMRHDSSSNMCRVPWTFCASVLHPCAS